MIIYGSGWVPGGFFSAGIGSNSGLLVVLLGSGVPLMFLDATGEFV